MRLLPNYQTGPSEVQIWQGRTLRVVKAVTSVAQVVMGLNISRVRALVEGTIGLGRPTSQSHRHPTSGGHCK